MALAKKCYFHPECMVCILLTLSVSDLHVAPFEIEYEFCIYLSFSFCALNYSTYIRRALPDRTTLLKVLDHVTSETDEEKTS